MVKVEVRVIGVQETLRQVDRKTKGFRPAASKALSQGALELNREVALSVAGNRSEPRSVDTGRFLASIDTKRINELEYAVYSPIEYAEFLEYGTSRGLAPRRHFQNSLNRNADKIQKIISSTFHEELKKA